MSEENPVSSCLAHHNVPSFVAGRRYIVLTQGIAAPIMLITQPVVEICPTVIHVAHQLSPFPLSLCSLRAGDPFRCLHTLRYFEVNFPSPGLAARKLLHRFGVVRSGSAVEVETTPHQFVVTLSRVRIHRLHIVQARYMPSPYMGV